MPSRMCRSTSSPGGSPASSGPNGAGESTFLAVLAGTLPASSGSIIFDGHDVTALPAFRRARRGLVRTFQLPSDSRSSRCSRIFLAAAPDNRGDTLPGALLGKRYWKGDEDRLVEQARILLDRFRMSAKESDYASSLSGGQKTTPRDHARADVAASAPAPRRPMSGVHPSIIGDIADYCEALRDEGLTILMVEHELHMIERMANPVVVMAQGVSSARGPWRRFASNAKLLTRYLVG